LSGGWGGYVGFVGTLGLVFNNFSARNVTNMKAWRPLPAGDGQKLALRFQADGRQFQTYSLTFTEPWLGGKRPNSFSVSLSRTIYRISDYSQLYTNPGAYGKNFLGSYGNTMISLGLGRRLRFPDDFFQLSNSL